MSYVDASSILCLVGTRWENQTSALNGHSRASQPYLILILFFTRTFRRLIIGYITSDSATARKLVSAVIVHAFYPHPHQYHHASCLQ